MQKVIKVCFVFCAVFALLSLSVLSVGAASSQVFLNSENFDLYNVQVSSNDGSTWVDPKSYSWTTLDNGWGNLVVSYPGNGSLVYPLLSARLDPLTGAGDLAVHPYMQLNCNLQYFHMFGTENYASQTLTGALYLVTPDGVIYEFPITSQEVAQDSSWSTVVLGGTAEIVEGFNFQDCYLELRLSGITNLSSVHLKFQSLNLTTKELISEETVKVVESIDKGFSDLQNKIDNSTQDILDNQDSNTQDIINNQDSNTDKITGSIEDSTDKITNGWDTNDDTSDKTNDAVNDLGSAEDEALGGKSDDEIKEEVSDALGQVTFPDQKPDNIIQVGIVFNNLLDVFGMQYQSLLILALSLGLGAFLVGRQYNAKG